MTLVQRVLLHTGEKKKKTPTDRPKSVRNRCVIEVFGGVFVLSRYILDFSVVVGAPDIRMSQISSFFSYHIPILYKKIFYLPKDH